jgi:hypothetical protein
MQSLTRINGQLLTSPVSRDSKKSSVCRIELKKLGNEQLGSDCRFFPL